MEDELPNESLTVDMVKIEDVTTQILEGFDVNTKRG
jgi:hypothetical protein